MGIRPLHELTHIQGESRRYHCGHSERARHVKDVFALWQKRDANRVECGLYVCRGCEAAMNADSNGAENIRRRLDQAEKVTLNPRSTEDRSSGRVARPVVNLFRRGEHDQSRGQGTFAEQASSCKS